SCCFKPLSICPLLSCFSGEPKLFGTSTTAVCCGSCAFTIPFFPVFPVWPEFCGRTLSWPAGRCPGPQSQWNPAPKTSLSAFPLNPEVSALVLHQMVNWGCWGQAPVLWFPS
uniref:Uncharacterized protein n=1 Tax=Ficedula albicollis TaxID=59894 RepID=A0A803V1Z2_FICAL